MKRWICTLCCLVTATAIAADKYPVLVYPCPRAAAPPKLDGRLDDDAWRDAPLVSAFTTYDKHETAKVQTAFRAVYDDDALYLGVQCEEPMWQKVIVAAPGMRDDHAAVFRSEAIEVFLDPKHDHANYYQIAANVSGAVFDGRGSDSTWNGHAKAAGAVATGRWTLEIVLPWADFGVNAPQPGTVMGLNVCRDRNLGDREWTSWAYIAADFHDPLHFGHIVLSGTPETIGSLSAEFRKGGGDGPLQVFGTDGFSGTTYLALAKDSLKRVDAAIAELESLSRVEKSAEVAAALAQRVAQARRDVAPLTEKVNAGKPFDAAEWLAADRSIEDLRQSLSRAVWEARLDALLRGI